VAVLGLGILWKEIGSSCVSSVRSAREGTAPWCLPAERGGVCGSGGQWASGRFPSAVLASYDMIGPHDAFGKVTVANLAVRMGRAHGHDDDGDMGEPWRGRLGALIIQASKHWLENGCLPSAHQGALYRNIYNY
jgi:hypothetical protein